MKPEITKDEIIDIYKAELEFVKANLSFRKIRPSTCLSDDELVKSIDQALSTKGLNKWAEIHRFCNSLAEQRHKL